MTLMTTLHALATDPGLHVLADGEDPIVPKYTPKLPDAVNTQVQTVLSWTAGLGLAGAVGGGLLGWLLVAVGHNSERAQLAARGKQSVLWSLFGAGGIGVTSSLVLAFYNMAK
ncbi:hypothetical protein OHU11_41760 (plasmid) [Streptomyces sp. NBC_00257]|uniref:hypothetical protein n=1 Tax=Streptomyces TaxID=1883 RepID=UPI00224DDCD5|nr:MULTISPECIES: hypothetical protein [unclassified Streptomyces]MCX5434708.1 hypothetical protein [Streptomyces sp. NBC_00062]WTD01012.1 hypothetical protein OH736_45715 [Streptomyces sp. NBC_01650]